VFWKNFLCLKSDTACVGSTTSKGRDVIRQGEKRFLCCSFFTSAHITHRLSQTFRFSPFPSSCVAILHTPSLRPHRSRFFLRIAHASFFYFFGAAAAEAVATTLGAASVDFLVEALRRLATSAARLLCCSLVRCEMSAL